MTRIDDCGMAEVFLSDEHVGFLRSCLCHVDPSWLKTRVGQEVKAILDRVDQDFLDKERSEAADAGRAGKEEASSVSEGEGSASVAGR